jgi:Response regulator containing a CheY-like receiver domain and an HTH DNA-binding domain
MDCNFPLGMQSGERCKTMPGADKSKSLVLMVDDSDDDGTLLELAFQKLERFRLVGRVSDGRQAIAYLKGEGNFSNRQKHPLPNVVLLDLRMPRVDGFDVLEWLRTQSFPHLRVVVFSGSDCLADVEKALGMGAHFFRTKPLRFHEQVSMLKALEIHIASSHQHGSTVSLELK